jgi:DnaK suppressor protein
MDKTQIKALIREQIDATQALIKKYKVLTQPIAPENAIGRVSRMDAINNKSVNDSALKKAQNKLHNLQVALSKVDDTDFGQCIKCRKMIPIGRILLMPQAISCVNCAY